MAKITRRRKRKGKSIRLKVGIVMSIYCLIFIGFCIMGFMVIMYMYNAQKAMGSFVNEVFD